MSNPLLFGWLFLTVCVLVDCESNSSSNATMAPTPNITTLTPEPSTIAKVTSMAASTKSWVGSQVNAKLVVRFHKITWTPLHWQSSHHAICHDELRWELQQFCHVTLSLKMDLCSEDETKCTEIAIEPKQWKLKLEKSDFEQLSWSTASLKQSTIDNKIQFGDPAAITSFYKPGGEHGKLKFHINLFHKTLNDSWWHGGSVVQSATIATVKPNTLSATHRKNVTVDNYDSESVADYYYVDRAEDDYLHQLQVVMSLKLQCNDNYYGCNCHRQCKADENNHYTCTHDGHKKCSPHWYPEMNNLDTCDNAHHICSRKCTRGWNKEHYCSNCGVMSCRYGHYAIKKQGRVVKCVKIDCTSHPEQLKPCNDNGKCINQTTINWETYAYYKCECNAGYGGDTCSTKLPSTTTETTISTSATKSTSPPTKTTPPQKTPSQTTVSKTKTQNPTISNDNITPQPQTDNEKSGGGTPIFTILGIVVAVIAVCALVAFVALKVVQKKRQLNMAVSISPDGNGEMADDVSDRSSVINPVYEEHEA